MSLQQNREMRLKSTRVSDGKPLAYTFREGENKLFDLLAKLDPATFDSREKAYASEEIWEPLLKEMAEKKMYYDFNDGHFLRLDFSFERAFGYQCVSVEYLKQVVRSSLHWENLNSLSGNEVKELGPDFPLGCSYYDDCRDLGRELQFYFAEKWIFIPEELKSYFPFYKRKYCLKVGNILAEFQEKEAIFKGKKCCPDVYCFEHTPLKHFFGFSACHKRDFTHLFYAALGRRCLEKPGKDRGTFAQK